MNLGILAFTILVLCTPGFFFRKAYYSGVFSKQYFKQSFIDNVTSTLLPSLIIHLVGYVLIVRWKFEIDIESFGILISGTDDVTQVQKALGSIQENFLPILSYFTFINAISFILGFFWKYEVRKNNWDSRFKMLRFRNEWHYIFSGEILNFPNISGDSNEISFAYVDIVTEIDGLAYIYSGLLQEYILSKEHILETICLSNVRRRKIQDDNEEKSKYYYIPGNFVVFKYNQIKNINITYYSLREDIV